MTGDGLFSLPLHVQKALVGRLLGFQALAPQKALLQSHNAHLAGEVLSNSLCLLTDAALDDVDTEESLESFLEGLVRNVRAAVAPVLPRGGGTLTGVLDDFAELVDQFRASPYDPLQELADAAAHTAVNFYQFYDARVPSELWYHTTPAFKFVRGETSLSFDPAVHLQAYTQFDTRDWRSGWVVLTLVPRWFDADTIAALPRVLLHEYISHVPQGPYFAPREHPDAGDSFAEGWMDYVAHCVHQSALDREGLSEKLAEHLLLTWMNLYRTAAERFFAARCAVPAYDRTAAERCVGAAAALSLHVVLRRLAEASALQTTASADDVMYRLSFALNTSRLSNTRRRLFVMEIRKHALYASRSDVLINALNHWISGELEPEALVARFLD